MRYIRASSVIVESREREIGIGDLVGAAAVSDGNRSRHGSGKGESICETNKNKQRKKKLLPFSRRRRRRRFNEFPLMLLEMLSVTHRYS